VKKIDDNLLAVTNCMFRDRENWKWVSEEQKIKFFFIVNRLLSKKYHELSQLLNLKNINQVVGMDLIFEFMKNKPYPKWFWTKPEKQTDASISESDFGLLREKWGITNEEVNFLYKFHREELEEEIEYFKKLNK
jgi:hypothetical protein